MLPWWEMRIGNDGAVTPSRRRDRWQTEHRGTATRRSCRVISRVAGQGADSRGAGGTASAVASLLMGILDRFIHRGGEFC